MTGQATATEARPKPLTLEQGFLLESPALRVAEALRQEKRAGVAPKWEQIEGGQKKPVNGVQVWSRTIGDFTAVATVGFNGDGTLRIDGPAGYSAHASEFEPNLVTRVLEALPPSVAPYLRSVPAAVPQRPVVKTVDVVVTTPAPKSGGFLGGLGSLVGFRKTEPEVKVQAAPVDRAAQVRGALSPLLEKLNAIEDKIPPSDEGLATYVESSQALRRSITQALTALEVKPEFATTMYTSCQSAVGTVFDALNKVADSALTQRQGVGDNLADDLRSLNDKIVGELRSAVDVNLLDALALAAAATGNDTHNAVRVAVTAAKTALRSELPMLTVLELHGAAQLTRATAARLTKVDANESTETVKQLFAGIDAVNAVDENLYGNYYPVFSTIKEAEKLVITGTGFWWNDPSGVREAQDSDLATVAIEGVTASLDEMADRVLLGLKHYFVDGGHIDGVTKVEDLKASDNEILVAWKNQAEDFLAPLAAEVKKLRARLDSPSAIGKSEAEQAYNEKKEQLFAELDLLKASLKTAKFNVAVWLDKNAI